jgi:hypothetical protein
MSLYQNLTVIAYLMNTVIAFGFAWIVERYRNISGKRLFTGLLITIGCWTLARGLQVTITDLHTHIFWAEIDYLAAILVACFWLTFSLEYSQRLGHNRLWNLVWVWIVPIITTGCLRAPFC